MFGSRLLIVFVLSNMSYAGLGMEVYLWTIMHDIDLIYS